MLVHRRSCFGLALSFSLLAAHAQKPADTAPAQLTIYNDNFAVARLSLPLDLHTGTNDVTTTDVTNQLEPDSVILRDPTGKHPLNILEQNYEAGVVNQESLLERFEGQTLTFERSPSQQVQARLIRAGNQPLVELDGHLVFQLPGTPVFPPGTDLLLLKPTLHWKIDSKGSASFPAELAYITHGLSWQATYNIVLPDSASTSGAEQADVLGWVTLQNQSGTSFPSATVQLMAGDVAKMIEPRSRAMAMGGAMYMNANPSAPSVSQKAFDDFHLYDLHRTLSLADGETKQVQFLTASGTHVLRSYEFDGNSAITQPYRNGYINTNRNIDDSNATHHIMVREEITNSEANHLGMPLPAGRIRLYRREASGQMQFVGESQINHTPSDQTLHLTSGQSFDLTAERKQTDFHVDNPGHNLDETFAITLHNAKTGPAMVHVVEHLNRGENWQIAEKSSDFTKQDSSTIDFPVTVPAKGTATLTYTVHYSW